MFKYISEIISKISATQRLTALIIVLLSIVIISIGPDLINGLTQDNEELKIKIKNQKGVILDLTNRVDELNDKLLDNQVKCTERILNREREVLDMLTLMEGEVQRTNNTKVVTYPVNNESMSLMESSDSCVGIVMAPIVKTIVKTDNSGLLKMVRKMRKDVEKKMESD